MSTPLIADDFLETWKNILTPDFIAPNSYQLYLIKGAKDFKQGKTTFDQVGIHVLD